MLFHFINVLLQVLLHKSHDLLQEEITLAIYNMASVDFDAFYSAFMPEFLNGCQGVDTSQRAVLARNFKLEQVRMKYSLYLMGYHGNVFCRLLTHTLHQTSGS